jgi:hypothetical protein
MGERKEQAKRVCETRWKSIRSTDSQLIRLDDHQVAPCCPPTRRKEEP